MRQLASRESRRPRRAKLSHEGHLRYYVRVEPGFDFAQGGVLPGLCAGACPPNRATGRGWGVRLRWLPSGEVAFEPGRVGTRARERRWRRRLQPGVWHALEVRVKLNRPGAADGVVQGWFDGALVATLPDLRVREDHGVVVDTVLFESGLKRRGPDPQPTAGAITFDNVAFAKSYIGPRP